MANVQTEIKIIEFHLLPEHTVCNVFYSSNEPGNPFWGGGWKTKQFPKSTNIPYFLNENIADFLSWDNMNSLNEF